MIKKFVNINNLGIFKDFEWDKNVVDSQGKPFTLQDINILFGRNYSGKTTLSRIIRSFETGTGLEKYEGGTFKLEMSDKSIIDENVEKKISYPIRVFNEDFVRENLHFINSPEQGVAPFAVLGGNVEIEQDIQKIKDKLGSSDEGNETGLYREKIEATNTYNAAYKTYQDGQNNLEQSLRNKATSGETSIRNQSEVYGDQNYNISKFKNELSSVTQKDILTNEQVDELKATLKEDLRQIPSISKVEFPNFEEINTRVKGIVEEQILASDKIEELVHNAMAHKWVEEGCELHKDRDTCLFCGGEITKSRWAILERHYDEATKDLNTRIEKAIKWINERIQIAQELYKVSPSNYYSCFKNEVEAINKDMDALRKDLISTLEEILQQLKSKQDSIHTTLAYTEHIFDFTAIEAIYQRIQNLDDSANQYGSNLSKVQAENRKKLRLSEVARFKKDTGYSNTLVAIAEKEHIANEQKTLKEQKESDVRKLEDEIKAKERLRQNEEEGAIRVNEILQSYFGHHFIELRSVKKEKEEGIYFDVFRQDKKAYNLSEGERNLIAFAYFIAKLSDVNTVSKKPIIWIDDPISSLDANHVFFVFSLIDQQVVKKGQWSQLFISTHNLDFLRYLKRLHTSKQRAWFLIERQVEHSCLRKMPTYMKEHVTEFNYLFHQIYKCTQATETENYELFYNFGNNARKFLEAYLYYKYPDNETNCLHDKMMRFFSNECAATTIDRIDNELSHLEGLIERGMSILDHAEIKKCAKFILEIIKTKDPDQYVAFLQSIGEQEID
ncbi:hypothetical protein IX307_000561 [Bacteroides pyogenes]|uniref:AAA family ATPase n=1 Tax=Bacteroides pyogenes TaxID=310300 RepID=UPI001BA563D4|nr:AAA family ATPase [Bacteroides pyogenes]MBR8786258.1 hypothetical protein [Bacteroides pyogenes]MBR8791741.1 hypothetical protein [Bacteroides pyogenes]